MFTIVLIVLAVGILAASFVALQRAVSGAVDGFENEEGFHGREAAPEGHALVSEDGMKDSLPLECL